MRCKEASRLLLVQGAEFATLGVPPRLDLDQSLVLAFIPTKQMMKQRWNPSSNSPHLNRLSVYHL